ncbi:SDR family NAD(P)-dependent oxidoreductase [Dactylosporangium sp. NPDC048998]|uniref:SDR family NAD(P)-dependent oxidoreductase n=1 Tax=Dactylosporangium sp. NPDC048998 TaxID=3363976 RepID=UPI00371119BC
MAGNAIYSATKTAVNWLSQVGRLELEGDNIQVTLLLPSVTATEFYETGNGNLPAGVVAHSSEYVGRVILRALRTGEERIDIPHGPEQPEFPEAA